MFAAHLTAALGEFVIRPRVVLALGIGFAIHTTRVSAQPAGMSGTWVATRDAPTSVAVAPSAVFGERFGITIGASEISIARLLRGASLITALPISGAEVRTALPGRSCMGDGAIISSVARTGDALTYSLSTMLAGAAAPSVAPKYIIRLESPDRLVVESTMRTSAQAAPTQVGTLYRRSTEPMPPAPPASDVRGVAAGIASLAWLVGDWEGPLGASTVQERWSPAAGGAMLAISRTTRASTMSAFEFLCIAERAGSLVYTARPNADAPTDFVLTHVDADSATFENPSHDFPKRIRYAKRPDGSMAATISGAAGQRATTFVFTKRGPG